MKPIQTPFDTKDKEAVQNLHKILIYFLQQKILHHNNEVLRRTTITQLKREQNSGLFGAITKGLVIILQNLFKIRSSGVIDEKTAKAINDKLREMGVLKDPKPKDPKPKDPKPKDPKPKDPKPKDSEPKDPVNDEPEEDPIIPEKNYNNLVLGKITDLNNTPLPDLKINIYDVNMRDWQILGEAFSDKNGNYRAYWSHEQIKGRDLGTADIGIKVFTKEKGTEVYSSPMRAVRFNASEREEINIQINQPLPKETIEYDDLSKRVKYLADKIAIADLQEDEKYQDVTFLSNELEISFEKIEYLIVANRLQKLSSIPASFFYGLFRTKALIEGELTSLLSSNIKIGLHANVQEILFSIALLGNKKIETSLNEAVQEMIISPALLKELDAYFKILTSYRQEAENHFKEEVPKRIFNRINVFLDKNHQEKARKIIFENRNDFEVILKKLEDPSFFENKKSADQVKREAEIINLFGLNTEWISKVADLKNIHQAKDLKKLARLNKKDWKEALSQKETGLKDSGFVNLYSSFIVRKMEQEFPTVAFASQLERESKPLLKNQKQIIDFLNKNEDFDLIKDNVDVYFKTKKLDLKKKEVIEGELKSVQRVFKLIPNYTKAMTLHEEKLNSSKSIVALGKTQFLKKIAPKVGLKQNEAEKIFKRAKFTQTAALLNLGNLRDIGGVQKIASFQNKGVNNKIEAIGEDFPNFKSLFKMTETCECEHCQSVYSPAAYLVEILQFLKNRLTENSTAKSVLFSRRPEIGEIELNCSNANTPVKYIDLVCEVLEEAIAPGISFDFSGKLTTGSTGEISKELFKTLKKAEIKLGSDKTDTISVNFHITKDAEVLDFGSKEEGTKSVYYLRDKQALFKVVLEKVNANGKNDYKIYPLRQTFGTAEELDAAPEHVNALAYHKLKNSSYAFDLPFDLDHTEAMAYFDRFDVNRADLMKSFQMEDSPSKESIAAERLGLTTSEKDLIFKTPDSNNNATQQKYWNVPAPGKVLDYLKNVDHFLTKTGISYPELQVLLQLDFIKNDEDLFIRHKDETCNTAEKEIANLNLDVLDRMHRFLRLQKKIKWNFRILDAVITQEKLGNKKLDADVLIKIGYLKEISQKSQIKIEELTGCFEEFSHKTFEDKSLPLYQKVFLNKARNGNINKDFLPENIQNEKSFTEKHLNYIANFLQIHNKDLQVLLDFLPDSKLNFRNLSILYTNTLLHKKLKLKINEVISLQKLSGIKITQDPAALLEFIELNKKLKLSPIDAEEIVFILKHEGKDLNEKELDKERIEEILKRIKKEFNTISEKLGSTYNDNLNVEEQLEPLANILSGLESLQDDDIKFILQLFEKNLNEDEAIAFFEGKLNEEINKTEIKNAISRIANFTDQDEADEIENAKKELIKSIMTAVAEFQIKLAKQEYLKELMAKSFSVDSNFAGIVLKYCHLSNHSVSGILSNDFEEDINSTNYPNQYAVLKWLHKVFRLISSFDLSMETMQWYFRNNKNRDLDFFEFENIPFENGQEKADFHKYLEFYQFIELTKEFPPVLDPLNPERSISILSLIEKGFKEDSIEKKEFLRRLSLLTGYPSEILDEIDNYFYDNFNPENYRNSYDFKKIIHNAQLLIKLGVNGKQIKGFIRNELSNEDVDNLRILLKSKYDDSTWQQVLKEIMDVVRPLKRDALVSYLLSTNPDLKNTNDLYEYFLIDVEMEACMPSSRIVQAHNSIQLFVQRCLMGLEPEVMVDMDDDIGWKQWDWMKNYRVWEANRKIFLYPENWYEVGLTQDKSPQLKELIEQLQQNELTNKTAEDALTDYLEKLDEISFLEVMATWYEMRTKTMHVFARTKGGDPATYYYRRLEKERYWTPWEKVDLDITGDHLLAFMRNNRLYLSWPIFSEIPDPGQGAKLPDQTIHKEQDVDKPRKKLKIQLAISEYADKKWKPKKISKEGIETPEKFQYTKDNYFFDKSNYMFIYLDFNNIMEGKFQEVLQPVLDIFSMAFGDEGIYVYNKYSKIGFLQDYFKITGCKGYPELSKRSPNFNFQINPIIKRTTFDFHWNKEIFGERNDSLVLERIYPQINELLLLKQTPGIFKGSYPYQLTLIDMFSIFTKGNFTMGAFFPYFIEDKNHSYVVTPGFYSKVEDERFVLNSSHSLTNNDKRTVSDIYQLADELLLFLTSLQESLAELGEAATAEEKLHFIFTNDEFLRILTELKRYGIMKDLNENIFMPLSENLDEEWKKIVEGLNSIEPLEYGEEFKNMYHPLICYLRNILYSEGISALMHRSTQLYETDFDFNSHYQPNFSKVPQLISKDEQGNHYSHFPKEDIDFTPDGSYSSYNWDLFFRIPLHIATMLTQNQRFEEAMEWFHYMFNPTGALGGNGTQKYWVTKPFYLHQNEDYIKQRIDSIMNQTALDFNELDKDLQFAISEWREKPFSPDVIARTRPVAYQKALLMKYINNLTEWGDFLFRQDTMESIAQATQMYILADKLLGPKPKSIPSQMKQPYQTYNALEKAIDSFGNALVDMENLIPQLPPYLEDEIQEEENTPSFSTLSSLYFCIPENEEIQAYWDKISDRLFKIRNCQNIDGVERNLALFAPPIDPGMLAKAAASGLDISSIVAGLNAPTPYYRFNVLSQKATDLAQEVRTLGNSLLQAIEKRDAEALSLLRNDLELKVLQATKDIKLLQIDEAEEQIEVLKRTKKVTEERWKYYRDIKEINSEEQLNLDKLEASHKYQLAAQGVKLAASIALLLPDVNLGASGFGGSPVAEIKLGGLNIGQASNAASDILSFLGAMASNQAARASIKGGYDRRWDDWKLQEKLAVKELDSIEKQITAAEIRKEIAETDLKNHELQIENAKKTDEFMRSKFSNKELYDWMIGQISSVYFKSYQLAHDFAKKAERCYQFELGNNDLFISYGYWDSMKKGLQSADALIHDIKRMEAGYLDKNKREYEITKHISLAQLDPLALLKLRATGICDFDIPEMLYDMDHPGQYFRRIKSVSISIPCIAGPYTSISAKLSLVSNRYRKNIKDVENPDNYLENRIEGDTRFVYNIGAIQSIATSSAQNDSGVFELNFRDERYLPFENTGAISSWRLELPTEIRQFDYKTISDVIIHVNYTAREGGSVLKKAANHTLKKLLSEFSQELEESGLYSSVNLKQDMPNQWSLLKRNGNAEIIIDKSRLPYFAQSMKVEFQNVKFLALSTKVKDEIKLKINNSDLDLPYIEKIGAFSANNEEENLLPGESFRISLKDQEKDHLDELIIIVQYSFDFEN